VSIAVATAEEWQGLKAALGSPAWAAAPQFASRYGRHKHRHALDQHLAQWTATRSAEAVSELLQCHGAAAVAVMGTEERLFNPHFRERGLYADIEHPALGAEPIFNHWIGDDGFLKRLRVECRRFNVYGDTQWCKGRVVRKYIHQNTPPCSMLSVWVEKGINRLE